MKRLLTAVLAAVLVAGVAFAATEAVTVMVKKASIRRDRQFYAPTIAEAQLGESFTVRERGKGWVKVGTKAGDGWLHETSVTAKKVAVSSQGPAGGKVDERDVANASKGFNPQVESAYRKKNPTANFAAVDRMEKLEANDPAVLSFVAEGNIKQRGAGK
ncbi:MAG: SH3 domain-containing protein [Candidatus Methylomirabilia bacterium]